MILEELKHKLIEFLQIEHSSEGIGNFIWSEILDRHPTCSVGHILIAKSTQKMIYPDDFSIKMIFSR